MNVPDPKTLYGGPHCGNEIIEKGEECDCGYPDECTRSEKLNIPSSWQLCWNFECF